jgi:hypothetical protein
VWSEQREVFSINLNALLILICPCATEPKSARFRCFSFLLYFTTCFRPNWPSYGAEGRLHPAVYVISDVYVMTVDTTSNVEISSMKTIDVLHVSTISAGHHQALMNITQVIKLSGIIWIRILAADGCVAREYIVAC